MPKRYVALVGIDADPNGYGPDHAKRHEARYEPGDEVPAKTIKASPWLLDEGAVVEADAVEPSEPTEETT